MIKLVINDTPVEAKPGQSILEAARAHDIYIPSLCWHPGLPPVSEMKGTAEVFLGTTRLKSDDPEAEWDGCGICAVEVEGEILRACATEAVEGMVVQTDSPEVLALRSEKLFAILADHPHACLSCAQAEGCPRTQCSTNVPEEERCCELLGVCELQRVAEFVGVPENLPKYKPAGRPSFTAEPLYNFFPDLCIGCLRCVRACQDLRGAGALGFVIENGKPRVGTTGGETRAESHCRFCGACVEVCPTGALMDKRRAVGEEREKVLVPCRNACPAGIDIPRLLRYIGRGMPSEATAVIRERVPLAFSASYVCFHPCEESCRRSEINSPVSVCRLKRFAVEHDGGDWRKRRRPAPPSGKKVAVVGSGPAGLTAAYYLAVKGHDTRIYEALPRPGGMLRVGIPSYRFPEEILERDIEEIEAAGVQIICNSPVDAARLESLASENDAVYIAVGAHGSKRIEIPGSDLPGVLWGVEFLKDHALGDIPPDHFKDIQVTVIGGGNVALDASRVALRLGAAGVRAVCLESAAEMPAWDWEVEEAVEEGVEIRHGWGPAEIIGGNGGIEEIVVKRCTRVFDDRGRFSPVYDDSLTDRWPAQAVVFAIGQTPSSPPFAACGLRGDGTIEVGEKTCVTAMDMVFAGGDVATGPASMIDAVAAGRRAAEEIDLTLDGDGRIDETLSSAEPQNPYFGRVENFASLERQEPGRSDPSARRSSFSQVEETMTESAAKMEALRCICCDSRLEISTITLPPRKESLLELNPNTVETVPETEGVYQLMDADKGIIAIKGVINLREALLQEMEEAGDIRYFVFEEDPLYTKRESELIQKYLQEHGELPGGGADELDDLF
jgi:NADPH-dependent glutamate synthase beta subunit-like oxidoreductase